jgi:hypothetical protein
MLFFPLLYYYLLLPPTSYLPLQGVSSLSLALSGWNHLILNSSKRLCYKKGREGVRDTQRERERVRAALFVSPLPSSLLFSSSLLLLFFFSSLLSQEDSNRKGKAKERKKKKIIIRVAR